MVEHPGRQEDGRVRQAVHRLRPRPQLHPVPRSLGEEEVQLLERAAFLLRQARRRRAARPEHVTYQRQPGIRRDDAGHVGVDAEQPRRCLHAHQVGDDRAPVAALRHVTLVAEACHQRVPGLRYPDGAPAEVPRLAGVPVARHRGDYYVEGVGRPLAPCAVGLASRSMMLSSSITEPGQPWREDDRERVLVFRADVDEVDVEPVDLGAEVRQGAQPSLAPAHVVLRRPVAGEFLGHRLLHALRGVGDEFWVWPAGGGDAGAQRLEFRLGGDRDRERPDHRGLKPGLRSWQTCVGLLLPQRVGLRHKACLPPSPLRALWWSLGLLPGIAHWVAPWDNASWFWPRVLTWGVNGRRNPTSWRNADRHGRLVRAGRVRPQKGPSVGVVEAPPGA